MNSEGTRELLIQLRDWLESKMPCPAGDCCNQLREWINKVDQHITSRPQPTVPDDARDAARYRWLRHGDNDEIVIRNDGCGTMFVLRNEQLDAEIDKYLKMAQRR